MTIWQASPPVPVRERPAPPERAPTDAPALDKLKSALASIPNDASNSLDYDTWRNVVFGIHHATEGSDEGLALAIEFSARSPKFDETFLVERVWPYINTERSGDVVTDRTIYRLATEHGWADPAIADDFEIVEPDSKNVSRETQRFEFIDDRDFSSGPPPSWFIKGVLPKAVLGVIYGASGSGKSFFMLDLMAAIARGEPWRDRRVKRGRVGVIVAEGAAGFRNRINAYCRKHEIDALGVKILADAPNFMEAKDVIDLGNAMRAAHVELLFVDTLAQVTPGADENAGEDMGRVIGHCLTLHKVTGAMVVLIHHSGKDASKGARGWSGIKGALDVEIEVTRCDHDRVATVSKMKDGPGEGDEFGFTLDVVPVEMDDDGDVVSSCVVEHGDAGAAKARQKRMPAKGVQTLVFKAVGELIGLDGALPSRADIIDAVVPLLPFDEHAGKRDQRAKDAGRALDVLVVEKECVRCENGKYRHLTGDELA